MGQGILKGKIYQQVSREIRELRLKGRILDDYADEKKHKYGFKSWVDLMKAIDDNPPDADLLEALMAMFYGVNKINNIDAERIVSYRLLQIAKRLTSGELLLLQTLYDAIQRMEFQNPEALRLTDWALKVARMQGHNLVALVLKDEKALMEEQLISGHRDASVTSFEQTVNAVKGRLTDLGIKFCQNIEAYRSETRN